MKQIISNYNMNSISFNATGKCKTNLRCLIRSFQALLQWRVLEVMYAMWRFFVR